jgi:hypothetical protein
VLILFSVSSTLTAAPSYQIVSSKAEPLDVKGTYVPSYRSITPHLPLKSSEAVTEIQF